VSVTATAFLQMLLDAYDPSSHDASSLRVWVSAGAPIPRAVVERARSLLPQTKILSLYGRSENLMTTTCTVDDEPVRSLDSDGAALAGTEVKIVDELGSEVPGARKATSPTAVLRTCSATSDGRRRTPTSTPRTASPARATSA